jgi:ABC-type phosphate transport system permease subunit
MELSLSQKTSLVFVGAFLTAGIVLSTMIFPFWNLIREDVFEEVIILANDDGICYVDTVDTIPKIIENCMLESGDAVTIKFGKGLAWATIVEP